MISPSKSRRSSNGCKSPSKRAKMAKAALVQDDMQNDTTEDDHDSISQYEKTYLNDLVLCSILKKSHFLERVPFELVSGRMAYLTRSTYKAEKVAIVIESAHRGDHCLIGLLERRVRRRYFGKNELYVPKKNFQATLEQFFARFKRFEQLQIRSGLLKAEWEPFPALIIEAISTEAHHPTEIEQCNLYLPSEFLHVIFVRTDCCCSS